MINILKITVLLIFFQSCNREQKIVQNITNDFSLIKGSVDDIAQNYDTCLSIFGETRKLYDGRKLVKFEITVEGINQIEKLNLKKTATLLNKGYVIKIDASCRYNIFFEKAVDSRIFGVTRYSVWYKHKIRNSPNIAGIVTPNIRVLKRIEKDFFIVELVEHFE